MLASPCAPPIPAVPIPPPRPKSFSHSAYLPGRPAGPQDEYEWSGHCADRARNGYNSGMGEIFRRVAAISPVPIPRGPAIGPSPPADPAPPPPADAEAAAAAAAAAKSAAAGAAAILS